MNIRNAPTKLMKELTYGRGYHYDPDYAHPVHNVSFPTQTSASSLLLSSPSDLCCSHELVKLQDFLPPQLAERSSHASASAEAFLQPEGSLAGKKTDEVALKEWEAARGVEWEGRSKMEASG
jgi:putative ATPase